MTCKDCEKHKKLSEELLLSIHGCAFQGIPHDRRLISLPPPGDKPRDFLEHPENDGKGWNVVFGSCHCQFRTRYDSVDNEHEEWMCALQKPKGLCCRRLCPVALRPEKRADIENRGIKLYP